MNKPVHSDRITVSLFDVPGVAYTAMRQLDDSPVTVTRTVSDLLLNEPFALGYAIGFAEQACWHIDQADREKFCSDYVKNIVGNMVGNALVAASFVTFAASKRGDRVFEGGYDVGAHDMNAWYLSRGAQIPGGLQRYLTSTQ